jgi:uncharacterized protein (DUF2384 family)
MKTEQSIQSLKKSFQEVARATREELPDLWNEAVSIWRTDEDAASFLCKPNSYFQGEWLLAYAQKSKENKDEVITYLRQIKYGVYP